MEASRSQRKLTRNRPVSATVEDENGARHTIEDPSEDLRLRQNPEGAAARLRHDSHQLA